MNLCDASDIFGLQKYNSVFSLESVVRYSLIQSSWQLYRIQLPQISKVNCIFMLYFCLKMHVLHFSKKTHSS